MKALTIWQPWATLIMIGAKPFEFRPWDYSERYPSLVDQRIVIHAGSRPVKTTEVQDIVDRLKEDDSSLVVEKALPLCERLLAAYKCRGVIPLSAALGTVTLGKPKDVNRLFKKPDSDRTYAHMFAWLVTDIEPWHPPVEMRGAQGFWNCPDSPGSAA